MTADKKRFHVAFVCVCCVYCSYYLGIVRVCIELHHVVHQVVCVCVHFLVTPFPRARVCVCVDRVHAKAPGGVCITRWGASRNFMCSFSLVRCLPHLRFLAVCA
jgi:hypothetical protein